MTRHSTFTLANPSLQKKDGKSAGSPILAWLILAALMVAPMGFSSAFYLHLAILICLNVFIVSGLALLTRTGQLSLCHAAFVGIGAYVSVLAEMQLDIPFLGAAALGTIAALLVAYILGSAILRLRGVYFVLITFAFGELFRLFMLDAASVTGGANGIASIPAVSVLGFVIESRKAFYCLAAALALASIAFLVMFFRTPIGHSLNAVGENPALAESSGISVRKFQLLAFTVGSGMAGLGGVMLSRYVGYISPESFSAQVSIAAIIMLVVGGRLSIVGPLIGALIMTPLPELFRGAVQSQNIFYGVSLILILRFLPKGIASLSVLRRLTGERL